MVADVSSPLCDDAESTPTPSVTVQGTSGSTSGIDGTCGTVTASSQGDPNATTSVDDTKILTLAEILKSQETLREDAARAKTHDRVELSKPKSSDIAPISEL